MKIDFELKLVGPRNHRQKLVDSSHHPKVVKSQPVHRPFKRAMYVEQEKYLTSEEIPSWLCNSATAC